MIQSNLAKKVFQMLASRNKFINMTLKQNLDAGSTYIRLYGYRKINFPFFTFCQPHIQCVLVVGMEKTWQNGLIRHVGDLLL